MATVDTGSAAEYLPGSRSLTALREAALGCRACPLWRTGTQTVFGEGSRAAEVMLVGEQPGDKEDVAGRPFVGPAGKLLDDALAEAEIDRDRAYVTNGVKHFKWQAKGKRRIHAKPAWAEIAACRPWLEAELDAVKPDVLVCLGATAAQALLGRQFRVTRERGKPVESDLAPNVIATIHPSAVLRSDNREQEFRGLVSDLQVVAALLG
jgi:uracil-DNA glycosylase family protein